MRALLPLCLLTACTPTPSLDGDGTDAPRDTAATTDSTDDVADQARDSGSSTTPPGGNLPPTIDFLGANFTTLTEGDTVVISAVVLDEDGSDDLIGGLLLSPDGVSYGAMIGSGGVFVATLSWLDLHLVEPIEFDGTHQRQVDVEFWDQEGATVVGSLTFDLSCPDTGEACDGSCVDTSNDLEHCGTCGNSCRTGGLPGECTYGVCHSFQECFLGSASDTCDSHCASLGMTCSESCSPGVVPSFPLLEDCETGESVRYYSRSCASTLFDSYFRCCCT